jgi:TonB family protein
MPRLSIDAGASERPQVAAVIISSCVDASGHLSGVPEIAKSSGDTRLDAGALKLARNLHYRPAQCFGKPVPSCMQFRVMLWTGPAVQG